MPLLAQRRGGEDRAVETLHDALPQHAARRPAARSRDVVVQPVEVALEARGRRQGAQIPFLARAERDVGAWAWAGRRGSCHQVSSVGGRRTAHRPAGAASGRPPVA